MMQPQKKAAAVFRALTTISVCICMMAKIVLSPPPLWAYIACIVLFLIGAAGTLFCENKLLGIRSEEDRRAMWKSHRRLRAARWAASAGLVVLLVIYLASRR